MNRNNYQEKSKVLSSRGKPNGLKDLFLESPNIWTNSFESSAVIKFLCEQGRHIYVHQTRQEQNQQKSNAKCYEIAQNVAQELFNIQKVQPRLIVFFFRQPYESLADLQKINTQQLSQKFVNILQQTSFLFNKQFIEEWIFITENLGKDIIKELFKDKYFAQQYSQIIQNTYIQHILNDMLTNQNLAKYMKTTKELENDFLEFVNLTSTKEQIFNFIVQLLNIYEQNLINYQPDYQDVKMSEEKDNQSENINENKEQQSNPTQF